jgi:hypothetical protein
MAHAAMPVADSQFLSSHRSLSFQIDSYRYQIATTAKGALYSVDNGTTSASAPLSWAFGSARAGQTYVYEQDGTLYESRMTYYLNSQSLDFTAGHARAAPRGIDTALGRPMDPVEARHCFACHTTAATTSSRFEASRSVPGVTCEACHGPGLQHVAAMNLAEGGPAPTQILNPAALAPVDSVEFCGACHRTKWDVVLSGTKGILNVRFQAYRLETSRCFGEGDIRITCIACHDPHRPLVHNLATYDKQCLSCHISKVTLRPTLQKPGKACRVSQKDCVTCHMPKISVPEIHTDFTDHRIRIVRNGRPFPD